MSGRPVWAYFPDNDRRSIIPLNVNITLNVEGKIALFVITILFCCIFRDPPQLFEFAAFMGARPLSMGAQLPLAPT